MSDPEIERWKQDLALLLEAANAAGEAAMSYFRKEPDVWWKNEGQSPVSAADYAANDILFAALRKARPDYGWLSEETLDDGARLAHDTLFVVDPIDGTRAFVNGKPVWCVSAAVVHRGRPVAGVLAAPALSEVYTAYRGGPALMNGIEINCATNDASPSVIAAPEDAFRNLREEFRANAVRSAHVPSLAYRLAMVANGSLHGTLVKPNSHDWDLAAAELILEMAGGGLRDRSGALIEYNHSNVKHGFLFAACGDQLSLLQTALAGFEDH
ncbi:3'(2'),5'-bisphosphate nucleotidase CysQ [Rhizobium sp. L1K21]|uniref:3'(2'),5'-bisphosphate nucleotidase CysQ n=1 Tax=Rhizobium sp. L1K21 TaxID=2954933 RepID=UPI00209262BA|nr:3'(2'),5'-bisphosphate nucleotidase CysQ [Rhizobium sp. L1K21]MCO6186966.1 3'(2'),5'-bisphosphate nucleotidase CysQ [Rhizobium sp. L1K21]